ncbi:MAG: 3-phosphoshikimate 1-carboxyvinyltransferase [Desulfobacterales bacterium]|jgi:3-phosphoshikimate 1-carboxyvinyltransferase|nr:3-phosphoshikimate 1-carboxyvinyltransferase [Desulfobacterales bacterium]
MKSIETQPVRENSDICVPGSKSFTHRILIASALSDGLCRVNNPLKSEDTMLTLSGLRQMGIRMDIAPNEITVHGRSGNLEPVAGPIHLGNSGTSLRLLTGICALGKGPYVLDGTQRMRERPIQDLVDGLTQIGVQAHSIEKNGCPPVYVKGDRIKGGEVQLKCGISSQFLSSMLLLAPYTAEGLNIHIIEGPVSKPYVDMTLEVMTQLGVPVDRDGYTRFRVAGGQTYRSGTYAVEPDCSQASYFWGAAAICGKSVKVNGTSRRTRQGDVRFIDVLAAMGCHVLEESDGICITGHDLTGVDVDMSDMPDVVPTLAVVAAFAKGTTTIRNVAHLKAKESDRLGAVVTELNRMGIDADCTDSGMTIVGGSPKGAEIETYEDHRIAMSFAMAGLKVPGIIIKNEGCVGKSFPDFWDVLETLYKS